jgi:hypothetical protein
MFWLIFAQAHPVALLKRQTRAAGAKQNGKTK